MYVLCCSLCSKVNKSASEKHFVWNKFKLIPIEMCKVRMKSWLEVENERKIHIKIVKQIDVLQRTFAQMRANAHARARIKVYIMPNPRVYLGSDQGNTRCLVSHPFPKINSKLFSPIRHFQTIFISIPHYRSFVFVCLHLVFFYSLYLSLSVTRYASQ